jgi:hypothetical protein
VKSGEASIADGARQIASWGARGASTPLSAAAYSTAVTRHPEIFAQLRSLGFLPILPAASKRSIGRCVQTPVGVLPRSIVELLGVSEGLSEYIIERLTPYCDACSVEATPPADIARFAIPAEGFLALVVADDDSGVPLRERCEWLGSERALVHESLVRVEDLVSDDGEPVVVIVPATSATSLSGEVSRWFSRGGSELRVMHFASRIAKGLQLGRLSGHWSCPRCTAMFLQPSRAALEGAQPCKTCSGIAKGLERLDAGWMLDDAKRIVACRDCDGFGLETEIANYRVLGVPLRQVMVLTAQEFCARAGELPEPLQGQLEAINACGFGAYPLGAPVELLSQGELALLSVLSGELSGFTGVRYLLDAAIVGNRYGATAELVRAPSIVYARPAQLHPPEAGEPPALMTNERSEDIVLRDVQIGSLHTREVRFPCGTMTVVQGPTGSGKSLLVSVVASRFAKRNKLAHCASFGSLKRCSVVRADVGTAKTVLEALGLSQELAKEIARTRRAQELGILEEDLILPQSRYRCGVCHGGVNGEVTTLGPCTECRGALYDWRVAELGLAGRTVAEVLSTPLEHLQGAMWGSDWLESVIRDFPVELRDRVALGSSLALLSQPEARFLAVWGGLIKVLSVVGAVRGKNRAVPLATDLVLIDGPCLMPVTQMQEIGRLLIKIKEMGATLVYADIPEGLESLGSCVLELSACEIQHKERASRPYMDTRYARTFAVVEVQSSQRAPKGK